MSHPAWRGGWAATTVAALAGGACAPPASSPAMVAEATVPSPSATPAPVASAFVWHLPPGLAPPVVPSSNPMSAAKVELGRRLFYEPRLSVTGGFSCASCHDQKLGFADGKARAVGATGMVHPRNSMGLANVAYASVLTWGNPLMTDLETQAIVPLTGDVPVEIGFSAKPQAILATLRADPAYATGFARSFPGDPDPIRLGAIARAIACFERTLLSFDAPYDRAQRGDPSAMSPAARKGADLFFGERLECAHCHDGPFFTDAVVHERSARPVIAFHNTGLFNLGADGAYPPGGQGVYEVTGRPNDMGKFRAPSLRNVAVTAPYFHDGSAATLAEVLEHYRVGGRTIATGPHAGVGAENPLKDPLVGGFALSDEERADVIAFLESLTDQAFLTNPAFSDPRGGTL